MTAIIRIDPDGTITDEPGRNLLGAARAALGNVDVFTLANPILGDRPWPAFVGCVGEWSTAEGQPTNWVASALYGRLLCGPAFIAYDEDDSGNRADLPDDLLATIRQPLAEWCPEVADLQAQA